METKQLNFKIILLAGLFTSLITAANLLGLKVVSLLGVSVSVGIFLIPTTFLITDIVGEVYGRKVSRQLVLSAVVSLLIVLMAMAIFVSLEPHERFADNDSYKTIFGTSTRIVFASLVAFFLSQLQDVRTFSWLKSRTKGKHLWLRNNISTTISQAIDTLIFMFIAFYQITPKFTFSFIIELAIPYFLFKVMFAALDTPLVYAGVRWLRR